MLKQQSIPLFLFPGITLFQLTTGKLPFEGQTIHQIFENIRSEKYEIVIPNYIDKNLSELLSHMLNRSPMKRWSLHQIRESMWFRKKHPFVPEDIANLPEEVIQNEYATFRMINYLEKLCQLKAVSELTSNDFSRIYDDMANQSNSNQIDPQLANMNINPESVAAQSNKNQPYSQPNNVAKPCEKQTKEYSQAAKAKKSHCSVM
jgi:serine/threonine protein kinase